MVAETGQAAFDAQCIPTASTLLGVSAYKTFLGERRRTIAQRLNDYLGEGSQPSG
jgi:hypothetical protein